MKQTYCTWHSNNILVQNSLSMHTNHICDDQQRANLLSPMLLTCIRDSKVWLVARQGARARSHTYCTDSIRAPRMQKRDLWMSEWRVRPSFIHSLLKFEFVRVSFQSSAASLLDKWPLIISDNDYGGELQLHLNHSHIERHTGGFNLYRIISQ